VAELLQQGYVAVLLDLAEAVEQDVLRHYPVTARNAGELVHWVGVLSSPAQRRALFLRCWEHVRPGADCSARDLARRLER
jgi:hypothetical protein